MHYAQVGSKIQFLSNLACTYNISDLNQVTTLTDSSRQPNITNLHSLTLEAINIKTKTLKYRLGAP